MEQGQKFLGFHFSTRQIGRVVTGSWAKRVVDLLGHICYPPY